MPLWLLIRPFWKHIAAALVVLALVLYVRHAWNERIEEAYESGVADTREQWKAQAVKEAEEARLAVEELKRQVAEQNSAAKNERDARENAERTHQSALAEARDKAAHDWQARFRAELAKNGECSVWSKQPIACPLR